jgi:UPF0176 protein
LAVSSVVGSQQDRFQQADCDVLHRRYSRCEKSTNYLIGQGVEADVSLKGGIINTSKMCRMRSTWDGSCFVFDARCRSDMGWKKSHILCYAAVAVDDRALPDYEGVMPP